MSKFGAPKNLWELCEQAVDAILMRPLNYYQDDFATDADTVMVNDDYEVKEGVCGTAYCRAGWMECILGIPDYNIAGDIARQLLEDAGIDDDDIDALFTSTGGGKYTNAKGFNEKPGTKAYARAGADGLKRFMKKHEMRLKAAKLVHLEGSKAQYKVVLPKALQNTEE